MLVLHNQFAMDTMSSKQHIALYYLTNKSYNEL